MKNYLVVTPSLLNYPLTYSSSKNLKIGDFVVINLRKKFVIGIIYDIENKIITEFQIKQIENKLPIPSLPNLIQILKDISNYQLEPIGTIFSLFIGTAITFYKSILSIEQIYKILKKSLLLYENTLEIKDLINYDENKIEISKFKYIDLQNSKDCLNSLQLECYQEIQKITPQIKQTILLEGETGSGKTLIYLQKIKDILIKDPHAQILILLPEIALTNAILNRVEKFLGFKPLPWHSNISQKERKEIFLATIFNISRVIIGARSAIFLPFQNLKLIIIDEEHDNSFKQEQGVFYHTIDIANILAQNNKNLQIILASATPSLETIYYVKTKKYIRIHLKSEKTLHERMRIFVENMRNEENKKQLISDKIIKKIHFHLEQGLQSMIFLNRRGYNSVIICNKCQSKISCKNCSVSLIYHKEKNKLFCPYCSYNILINLARCNHCLEQNNFKFYGFGIEKIFEMIKNQFPNKKVALLSSDNSSEISENIRLIENGETEIIVGTQILAKGHNFPKLGFLAIIDGGLNFSGVDLRSAEKTYQILHQIMGRLGRFNIQGEVIIQTYEPENLILQSLLDHNRVKFYMSEFKNRQDFDMPPFCNLFKISFSDANEQKAMKLATKFVTSIDYDENVEIIGPSPSAIIRINRMYKYNLILKAKKNFNLQEFLKEQIQKHNLSSLKMRIDVNPMNFI
jgi:primosomal protein N' (replication factor Y)